jgi:hypothetical protein
MFGSNSIQCFLKCAKADHRNVIAVESSGDQFPGTGLRGWRPDFGRELDERNLAGLTAINREALTFHRLPSGRRPTCLFETIAPAKAVGRIIEGGQGAKTEILAGMLWACFGGGNRSPEDGRAE